VPLAFSLDGQRVDQIPPSSDPGTALDGPRLLLNPGSVGQPRDGDPRAAYLVLDLEVGRVTWHRVLYDIETVQAGIRAAGLPVRLAARLAIGA
jgi:diadenosine tetraphosphatase ApaH/serine/threonine PP2A family protein phosphatase